MLRKFRRLPSPALVIAAIALVLSVGGGTFAIAALTHNDKTVVKKIAKKVANKRITARASGLSVNNANKLDNRDSTDFLSAQVKYIKGPTTSIPADGQTHLLDGAICPAGSNVVGGGLTGSFLFRVAESYPTAANGSDPGREGWTVRVENTFGGGGAADGNAVAICVTGAQAGGTWP